MLHYRIIERESFRPFERLLINAELHEKQALAVAYALIQKKVLINFPTGRGKSYIMSAFVQAVYNKKKGISVVIVKNKGVEQIYNTLMSLTNNLKIQVFYGDLEKNTLVTNANVILMSYEALQNEYVYKTLFKLRDSINCVVVDESLALGNSESYTHRLAEPLIRSTEFVLLLTATPLRRDPAQFIAQLNLLNPHISMTLLNKYRMYDNVNKMQIGWKKNQMAELLGEVISNYFFVTDNDFGFKNNYIPLIHEIESDNPEQTIDDLDEGQMLSVMRQLQKRRHLKGIIYCNKNKNKRKLIEYLDRFGFKYGVIDGEVSKELGMLVEDVKKDFSDGNIELVITNVTDTLDLPANYIYFYETTVDAIQVIGRGSRGLGSHEITLIWAIILGTSGMNDFERLVYERSELLRIACGNNISAIKKVRDEMHGRLA